MKTRPTLILITLLCAAMTSLQNAHAATITVTNTNDSGAGSLRQALADANDGDTINFSVATPATITLTSGELVVNKNLTITGPTTGRLSVNGNAASTVFHVLAPDYCVPTCMTVAISNLTITNGLGGIYNFYTMLTITNSTISGNLTGGSPDGCGGSAAAGIFNESGTVIIDNSTISNNSGVGIDNGSCLITNTAALMITNSTLSDNSGYGIVDESYSAGLTIGNTILKGSSIYDYNSFTCCDYGVPPTSLGYNMSDDGGGVIPYVGIVLTGPGDRINTDPLLGPLQDNGGPTFTHALLCNSPAINAGNPNFTSPPDYDQRGPGFPRVVNGRIDIGAFEVQGTSNSYTGQVQPPINADGTSVFTVKRGVVPVKFSLTDGCSGTTTCALPTATIAVTRIAGGTTGAINESVYTMPSDNGPYFRVDGCQYIYNLNSSALGVGTYRVDILINSQVVGSATFQLK